MGLLGNYVADIEANISDFTTKLDKADKHYQDFYNKQIAGEKKRLEIVKNLLEDELNIRINEGQSISAIYNKLDSDRQKKVKKNTDAIISELKKEESARLKAAAAATKAANTAIKEAERQAAAVEKAAKREATARANVIKKQQEEIDFARNKLMNWAAIGISIPVTLGLGKGLENFIELQNQLFNVKAVTGATTQEFRNMLSTALEMSSAFNFTASEIASAFLEIGQAGYNASEILTSAKDVMILSAAGMKDIAFTSNLVTTTLEAFNLEADSSGRIVDVFARSAAKSVSSLDKISASLKYTAGLWGSQNWEIENLIGILDILYDTGVRGEKAGRLLASAINGLNKPTASAAATIKKLTGSANSLNPAMNDVTQIVKKLAEANATTSDIFRIFGKEGTDVILRLLQNVDKLDSAIAEVTGKSGEAAKQANIQMQSLGSAWEILKNKVTVISSTVINTIEPALVSLIKAASSLLDSFNKMPDWIKTVLLLGTSFAALSPAVLKAGTTLQGLLTTLSGIKTITSIAGLSLGGFALAAGAVGVAVAGVAVAYSNAKRQQEEWFEAINQGTEKLTKQGKDVKELIDKVRELFEIDKESDEFKKSLWELSEVFPKLRKELVEGSGDMARAMKVFNDEYARFTKITSDTSKAEVTLASNGLDEQKAQAKALNDELTMLINNLNIGKAAQKEMVESFKANKLIPETGTFKDVIEYLKANTVNMTELAESIKGAAFLQQAGYMQVFADKLKSTSDRIKFLNINIEEFERLVRKLNPELAQGFKENLLTELDTAIIDISKEIQSIKVFAELTNTDGLTKAVKAAGEKAGALLNKVLEDYSSELKFFEVIDEQGNETKRFDNYFKQRIDKIKSLIEDKGINFWEALKIESGGILGIDDFIADMQTYNAIIASVKGNLSELSDSQKETLSSIGERVRDTTGLFAALVNVSEDFGKKPDVKIDWWEQIKQNIKDTIKLLEGIDVTSLTKINLQIKSEEGEEFEKLKNLALELNEAFNNDAAISKYTSGLDILQGVIDNTTQSLDKMYIAKLKDANVDTSILEYISALKAVGTSIRSVTEQQRAMARSASPEEQKILTEQLSKLNEELLKTKLSFGVITQAEFDAANSTREFYKQVQNNKSIQEFSKNLKNGSIELDELYSLAKNMENISILNISDIGTAINGYSLAKEKLKELNEELKAAKENGNLELQTTLEIEVKKAESAVEGFSEKIEQGFSAFSTMASDIKTFNKGIIDITKAWKQFAAGAESAYEASMKTVAVIGENFTKAGSSVALFNPIVGGVLQGIGAIIETVPLIFDLFQNEFDQAAFEMYKKAQEFDAKIAQITKDTVLDQDFSDLGSEIGDSIVQGILSGDSWENVEQDFRRKMFSLVAQQLLTLTGFRELLATKIENLWDTMASEDQRRFIALKKQTEQQSTQIDALTGGLGIEAFKSLRNVYQEKLDSASKKSEKEKQALKDTINQMDIAISEAERIEKNLNNANKEMEELSKKEGFNDITTSGKEFDEALKDITDSMEDVYNGLGDVADGMGVMQEKLKSLTQDLNKALATAVLTGSFRDFKQAVYGKITEAVTDALLASSLFKGKIQKIIDQILAVGNDFTSLDANAIIAEINKVWGEATDINSPLGQIIQALRGQLGEFGEMDINVNPANVVTALPADVQDKLVTAIREVTENLSKAITEAGLNSNIGVVNIALAQIQQMIATQVIIQNAVFEMSGNIVLQNINGNNLATWLENAIKNLIAASAP